MKSLKRNIIFLSTVLLFASFTVSYAHNIIEEIGTGCEQHENHDFSKVMINANLTNQNNGYDHLLNNLNCFEIVCEFDSGNSNESSLIDGSLLLPRVYYEKLFLIKTVSLLI